MHLPKPVLRHPLFIALLVVILPSPAMLRAAERGDVFAGYSRTGSNIFYPGTGGLNGWDVDGQVHWKPFLGLEGDVAHYGLGSGAGVPRTTSVLFGPKASFGPRAIRVFGHFLVGGEHSASSGAAPVSGGAFAYALGAGADVPIAPFFGWRVQVDRLSAPTQSSGTPVRFTTGIVLRF